MITFRQKEFSEFDAMRSLYVEILKRTDNDRRRRFPVIDSSALLPILKGNNVVVERFVISTSMFGKDKYRMYLKIGAKAKLPDEVRLPGRYYDKKLGDVSLKFNGDIFTSKTFTKKKNNGGNQQNQQGGKIISSNITPYISIEQRIHTLLGEAIKYDKRERSLVLEFESIEDAISALNILPFGIDYKIYLLDA